MYGRKRLCISNRNHILPVAGVSMLLGCRLALLVQPGAWLWALLAVAGLLALTLCYLGKGFTLALALCFCTLGTLRTSAALHVPQPVPGRYCVTGFVCGGVKQRSDNRMAFTLSDVALDGAPAEGKAYVSLHYDTDPPQLYDGAYVRFEGRVYLPEGKAGETHMDFRLWMLQNDLRFGIAAYQEISLLNMPQTAPVKDWAYRARKWMEHTLQRTMGEQAGTAMAMLVGQREGMAEEELEAFRTLGIIRVMSVSGLQVGLLAAAAGWLLQKLRLGRRAVLGAQCALALGYCALAGFSSATLRALCMLACYGLSRLCGRYGDRMSLLSLSALLILLLRPLNAFSAGFVMSFSAMLGLIWLTPPIRETLDRLLPPYPFQMGYRRRKRRERLKQSLALSLAAQAGVLLPTAAYFHQLPLYGVLINLTLVPLVSGLLLPMYALLIPLSLLPWAGGLLGGLAAGATQGFLWLVSLLSRLPYASVRVAAPDAVLAIGIGAAVGALSRRTHGSLARKALAAALCVAVGAAGALYRQPPALRYIQLAVGQADSALLLDGDQTILIDAGDDGQAALDLLLAEGRDVDALYISHLHMDHIGGVQALLDADISIRQVYLPVNAEKQKADPAALAIVDELKKRGICITELAKGDRLRYNNTAISVLWPENAAAREKDANAMCMTLCVDFAGYRILCTADLTGVYENYAAVYADVLKVAHHGSAASTSQAFLDIVRPQAAFISCSSGSAYLPSAETLERLSGIPTLRTDQCGDITLTVQDGKLLITPYKERNSI